MLDVNDVHKTFPPARGALRMVMRTAADQPVDALSGVSFGVRSGEVVGLVGRNGAGKTTLFRLIATVLEPTAGSILVDGFSVRHNPEEVRQRIGLLLDGGTGLYGRLTGRANLEFFGTMAGLTRSAVRPRATELLEQFDLAGRDRRVFGYSSGMRVRLALARALIARPPLLATPMPEDCNGRDDDCNGLIDDGVARDPAECQISNDHGRCPGLWVCEGASGRTGWLPPRHRA